MFSSSDSFDFTFQASSTTDFFPVFVLDNYFQSFHLASDDPSDLPLPPACLPEAADLIRRTSISHSASTLSLLHKNEIMYLPFQRLLPTIYLIRDLDNLLFFNYFAVHMAALQNDLALARIPFGSPLSDFWLLRARGYTDVDVDTMSQSTKAAAVSGTPFMAPRLSAHSQDVLFYLLWTRRQFHVYLMRVHTWGCKNTDVRHFFAPVSSSWVEPLSSTEVSELRRRLVAGPRAYGETWSAYATTAPTFPALPPLDITPEISSHSVDGCSLSCSPLRESALFTDSTLSVVLYEEIFLRVFHFFFL